jgi:hypothetical protein
MDRVMQVQMQTMLPDDFRWADGATMGGVLKRAVLF